jgi:hypothetical protein
MDALWAYNVSKEAITEAQKTAEGATASTTPEDAADE